LTVTTTLLEERKDWLVIMSNGSVDVVAKDSYSLLRYKHFRGLPISYIVGDRLRVREEGGAFDVVMDGVSVRVGDREAVSNAVLEHKQTGDLTPLGDLFNLYHLLCLLQVSIVRSWSAVDLTRDGKLQLRDTMSVRALEWTRYDNGAVVGKVRFDQEGHDEAPFFRGSRTGLALVGRDEANQPWLHFLPPEYIGRDIMQCELWLVQGQPEDRIVF
jgi:hypothetical protein